MIADAELLSLVRDELALCKVHAGEAVVVLTDDGADPDYVHAFLTEAQQAGAMAFQVNLPKRPPGPGAQTKRTALTGNQAAIDALKGADMVVDMIGLLWSPEQKQITDAGTRMLLVREPLEVLRRMFPTKTLRRRVEAAVDRLATAKILRVVSDAGTDVTYRLGKFPAVAQYGYTDLPGRWDHWPGGFAYTGGDEDGVEGTVVIATGDIILPFMRYMEAPIRLTIERGMVERIDGGGADAELLRDYLRRWNDPRAYAVSHIGWGLDETALWDFMATSPLGRRTTGADCRAYYGNVLFSTGPNSELGGGNDTSCHLDIPLKGCSLYLDGEMIIDHGDILPDDMRADGR